MAPPSFREIVGIPASTASTNDSCLLIIDAQNEYASGALKVTNAAASGKVIADLLDGEETIWKLFPGAFEQTSLHETLQKWGVKKVVLTGYMAHVCVSTTAREAFQKGYEVILVEDAIGDRDIPGVQGDEVTRVALAELGDVFGTVVKSADIE
ncbi:isochorismatase family hydrolase [Pyrenophora tritici-repentis]|nr:isochorismatase family hydrolase [Pyrenophora tritici-repentis]KAI0578236.1 isochorismatase family hydrolase [Pyrenophora tritici-repentis]KAI0604652.1 isochorismatase family hydrolase [Pyrenophora tritici-repentis]KAI0619961.1 isochorismatase family hydrolase [Pyrenophora tritici-repentis]KAI1530612.1 isochorismatase hydrolase [Pyrenophora tritici-repentis]